MTVEALSLQGYEQRPATISRIGGDGPYAKIVSFPGEPSLDNFTANAIHTNMERTGFLETSDQDLNQLAHNILWGLKPDKLYHSYLTYDTKKRIGALVDGESYYVRVDVFNENGITEGRLQFVESL